jgi:antitoxin component YwqK of YwqJK toxin-antitoxin module
MRKIKYLLIIVLVSYIGYGQNENVLYVVDSIPIIEEPEEGFGILDENEIDRVEVLKNKQALKTYGYENLDGIIYVFTKEYESRPDSNRAIPTTKIMTKRNGTWYLKGQSQPYSGPFIDYYLNGKKQGEGILFNGRLKGKRSMYYLNGNVSDEIEYDNGISNGLEKRFYEDGTLMQKGTFKNDIKVGVWEKYHRNGQISLITNFDQNGKPHGERKEYFSTGQLKSLYQYDHGDYIKNKEFEKFYKYFQEGQSLYKSGNFKAAIKKYSKSLELDSISIEALFARGTAKLNNLEFDSAILDFDKAIEIEPLYMEAYGNRAFCLIRKHEFANSNVLSKTNGVTVMAEKEFEIPHEDIEKICKDLEYSVSLGNDNPQILEAKNEYCK